MEMKRLTKKLWDFFGSRNLSVFVFIMGLTYTFFLVIFSMVVPLPWVTNIAKLLPFKVLYSLFFINLIICEIKWIPVVVRRCGKLKPPETDKELGRFRHKVNVGSTGSNVTILENYLKKRCYRLQKPEVNINGTEEISSSKIIYAYRGRFSPIGSICFHLAFLFLLGGVVVSMLFRFEGSARITEGYPFTGTAAEYSMISASPFASLPRISFFLEKITPEFWADELLFTDLRADISYDGVDRGSAWMSSPLNIEGSKISINGISLTPMYILKNKEGRELDVGYVNLAIFTPASEDHFQIPGFPHQIFVSFYPDFAMEGERPFNRSMNVKNPKYFVRVFRGRIPAFSGFLKPGEEARFENLRLSFPKFRYWGDFRIIKDPGLVFIWTAFVFFGLGLVWRLLFYRREIAVVIESDKVTIYGNSDYYPSLFENRLRMLKRMVEV